jgi:sulfite reductase alpha subunit-like flavoprotein
VGRPWVLGTIGMELRDGKSILVLYGTETGNSKEIAEHLGRMCQRLRFPTLVKEMDEVKLVCSILLCNTSDLGSFVKTSQRADASIAYPPPPRSVL